MGLRKVRGLCLLDKVKSTDIRQSLNIELAEDLKGDPELTGEIMLKTWPGHILQFHHQNCC